MKVISKQQNKMHPFITQASSYSSSYALLHQLNLSTLRRVFRYLIIKKEM